MVIFNLVLQVKFVNARNVHFEKPLSVFFELAMLKRLQYTQAVCHRDFLTNAAIHAFTSNIRGSCLGSQQS